MYFNEILVQGNERQLQFDDLVSLPSGLVSRASRSCFESVTGFKSSHIEVIVGSEAYALGLLFWKAQKGPFLVLGLIALVNTLLSFGGPLLIGAVVSYIQDDPKIKDITNGLVLVLILCVVLLLSAVCNTQNNIRGQLLQLSLKGGLSRAVFSVSLSRTVHEWSLLPDMDESQVLTLMQVDVDRASGAMTQLHNLWALPIQVVVAFALLYSQVKLAFLVGVLLIVVMVPVNARIADRIGGATARLMVHKDARLGLVSEALRNMKGLKMHGWERLLFGRAAGEREGELHHLATQKYLDALCVFMWAAMPVLVPFATFVTSAVVFGQSLTAPQVFTTMALLNMLIFPMNAFPWVVNGLMEARVSMRRVARCLAVDPNPEGLAGVVGGDSVGLPVDLPVDSRGDEATAACADEKELLLKGRNASHSAAAEIGPKKFLNFKGQGRCTCTSVKSATNPKCLFNFPRTALSYRASEGGTAPFVLQPLSQPLCLERGDLVGLVGSTAAGKSTLLLGMLGELRGLLPFSSEETTRFSYCAQVPALHNGTVRENVLFGSPFHDARYQEVTEGCGLLPDIAEWSSGDGTNVGQGGCKLSGGQRLRVGVARALYAFSEVVLLDDPYSALDADTAAHVCDFVARVCRGEALCSFSRPAESSLHLAPAESGMRGAERAVVVSTHSKRLLAQSSTVLTLSQGAEVARGGIGLLNLETLDDVTSVTSSGDGPAPSIELSATGETEVSENNSPEDSDEEHRAAGAITSSVYLFYVRSMGVGLALLVLASTALMQASSNGMSIYLAYWASQQDSRGNDGRFLLIMGVIVGVSTVATLVRSYSFAAAGLIACRKIYDKLATAVCNAPQGFFDQTPVGRIINRFGKDANTIDEQLPFITNIVLQQCFALLGSCLTIVYSCPAMVVVLTCVFLRYYVLQEFYRSSSRELKRLDSIHRSPVFTLLGECLANGPAIRACRSVGPVTAAGDRGGGGVGDTMHHFEQLFERAVDESLCVSLNMSIAQQWLGVRLQLLGIATSLAIIVLSILSVVYDIFPMSPGLVGLSLLYSMNVVNTLSGVINSVSEAEQSMVSVERVLEYIWGLEDEFGDSPQVGVEEDEDAVHTLTESLLPHASGRWRRGPGRFHIGNSFGSFGSSGKPSDTEADGPTQSEHPSDSRLVLRNVSLGYEPLECRSSVDRESTPLALVNISLDIPAGARVAVVGRTGSGKSSLMNLLLLLYPYRAGEGSVTLGGVELGTLSKRSVRGGLVYAVSQDVVLFSGSVRLNVDPEGAFPDELLLTALRESGFSATLDTDAAAGILDRTVSLSNNSGKNGDGDKAPGDNEAGSMGLSQGQKQLLCISRLFLQCEHNCAFDILLLDEIASSLDDHTRELVRQALLKRLVKRDSRVEKAGGVAIDRYASAPSLLMIVHRVEDALGVCDLVLKLGQGAVEYYGPISNYTAESTLNSSIC